MKCLKNRRGEGYIDVAVAVLVIAFVLIFIISVWSMMTVKQDMRAMCNELVEIASVTGRVGTEVYARYAELCTELGYTPTLTVETTYFDSTGKVQLGEIITITLTTEMTLPGFGDFELPFEVSVSESGLSRMYWK